MKITSEKSIVAIAPTHSEAEHAVRDLKKAGFDMSKLSIVGKDFHTEEHVVGYYNTGDRMKAWGTLGAFWGGIWGLLAGAAFFSFPGVGPVLVGGFLVNAIVSALEGAFVVGGLSALGAGLYSLGIPKDSVLRYETALRAGKYLLVVHGTEKETDSARELLSSMEDLKVEEHEMHKAAADSAPEFV